MMGTEIKNEQIGQGVHESVAGNSVVLKINDIITRNHNGESKALTPLYRVIATRPDLKGAAVVDQMINFSRVIGLSMQQEDAPLRAEALVGYQTAKKQMNGAIGQIEQRQQGEWTRQFETFWKNVFDKELQLDLKRSGHAKRSRNNTATEPHR